MWDINGWKVSLKSKREDMLRTEAKRLKNSEVVTCREVSKFLGRATSAMGAVPLARARIRTLQWEFLASCRFPEQFDDHMILSNEARSELTEAMLGASISWYWSAMMEARCPVVLVCRS